MESQKLVDFPYWWMWFVHTSSATCKRARVSTKRKPEEASLQQKECLTVVNSPNTRIARPTETRTNVESGRRNCQHIAAGKKNSTATTTVANLLRIMKRIGLNATY